MKVTHDYYYFIDYFLLFITNYKGLTVLEKKTILYRGVKDYIE